MPHALIRQKAFAISSALALTIFSAAPTQAADGWAEKIFNPQPASDDVVLPMPCGGAMAFRKVLVPGDNPYADYQVTLGGSDDDRGFAEGTHTAHIAGSFAEGKTQRYYLMAKYETSQAQYEAVMQDQCPPAPSMAKRLPQSEVGWMDAVAFADRYSRWLRKSAQAKLPKDGAEIGYARLPTEEEWEFAARGGIKVSPAEFGERVFPMAEGMAPYVWFAGTQSANGKPQLTGLLKPNPLGLHDMLGNLDEIVFEPFHLNRLDRPHGQAGAFIVRGGNYLTSDADMRSAYRQEVPYYEGDGPRRSKTTGIRLVIAAPVLSSPEKLRQVQAEWSKLGATSAPDSKSKSSADPLEELDLLAKAAPDPATKSRLQNVQTALRANIAARDEQRDRAAKSSLRLGAFLGRKLADDSRAVDALAKLVKARMDAGNADDPRTKDFKAELDREQEALNGNLRYYADTLIRTAEDYGADVLSHQKEILLVELKGMGLADLGPFVEKHFTHVATYRKDQKVARSQWLTDWNKMQ